MNIIYVQAVSAEAIDPLRREISIRRAVGSRKRDIILQFLMESSFISVSGGIIGMAAGLNLWIAFA